MKPSDRIIEINTKRSVPKTQQEMLKNVMDSVIQYLDEQWEESQLKIEQLKKDLKPM